MILQQHTFLVFFASLRFIRHLTFGTGGFVGQKDSQWRAIDSWKYQGHLATENHLATKCDVVWIFVFLARSNRRRKRVGKLQTCDSLHWCQWYWLRCRTYVFDSLNDKKDRFHDDIILIMDISWVLDATEWVLPDRPLLSFAGTLLRTRCKRCVSTHCCWKRFLLQGPTEKVRNMNKKCLGM